MTDENITESLPTSESTPELAPTPVSEPVEEAVAEPVPVPEPEPVAAAIAAPAPAKPVAPVPFPEPVVEEPTESFADLLRDFERTHSHKSEPGSRQLSGTVVSISADQVFLDIGYKTEAENLMLVGVLGLSA